MVNPGETCHLYHKYIIRCSYIPNDDTMLAEKTCVFEGNKPVIEIIHIESLPGNKYTILKKNSRAHTIFLLLHRIKPVFMC